jgi:ADP-ribose pyrophosphatase
MMIGSCSFASSGRRPAEHCSRSGRGLDAGPGGTIEDPAVAAARELEEETGQLAWTWQPLGSLAGARLLGRTAVPLPGHGLSPADGRRGPDADEALVLVRVPVDEAIAAAEDGRILDAKSIVGLLRLARIRSADPAMLGSTGD